jgi:hypothetical protein
MTVYMPDQESAIEKLKQVCNGRPVRCLSPTVMVYSKMKLGLATVLFPAVWSNWSLSMIFTWGCPLTLRSKRHHGNTSYAKSAASSEAVIGFE